MNIKYLACLLCLMPLTGFAVDAPSKPATSNQPAQTRALPQKLDIPGPTGEEAGKALFEMAGLYIQFDNTIQPLIDYDQPFRSWAKTNRDDLRVLVDAAKVAPTPAEVIKLVNQAKPQFYKATKIAQQMAAINADLFKLNQNIALAESCLAKRQSALQQANDKIKAATQLVMVGFPANVSSLNGLVTDAKTACP